jgi:hypothetical protein
MPDYYKLVEYESGCFPSPHQTILELIASSDSPHPELTFLNPVKGGAILSADFE